MALLGLAGVSVVAIGTYAYFQKSKGRIEESSATQDDPSWEKPFLLSVDQMKQMIKDFQSEMEKGLQSTTGSSMKMLTSFTSKPTGKETGSFYALDLGGTNFRVIKLELRGNKVIGASVKQQYTISQEVMRGNAEQLFGFIADCISNFISTEKSNNSKFVLGFTFSFPVNQTGIASGTLISWTKGFTTKGVEGNDVVKPLNQEFKKRGISAEVAALVNDTVGTMVARCYEDDGCEMGLILGTGTNACYSEKVSNIKKLHGGFNKDNMIINMEWGAFGDGTNFLPLTKADRQLDQASLNPGKQLFEKMISGMYLGEIVRQIMLDLIDRNKLSKGFSSSELLKKAYCFETSFITLIENDDSNDLSEVQKLLEERLAIVSTVKERQLLKRICHAVSQRAARLSATAVIAVLSKVERLQNVTVAVDGGVFEHLPGFRTEMEGFMKKLSPLSVVKLVLQKDGSGNGAAIIAATTQQ